MPRYEHKCLKDICEFLFEVTYSITEEPNINCPKCASPTQRQISANVMFETPTNVDVFKFRKFFPRRKSWIYPTSIDNMILQWTSIHRVFEWAMTVRDYDNIGLFRLDVVYMTNIDINDGEAVIPHFLPSGGLNDRMFYGKSQYARIWSTRFPFVEEYTNKTGHLHSESFLK